MVRLTALSGSGGEFRLNNPVPQGVDIIGTGPDTTFSGTITGGNVEVNIFRPDGGSRFTKSGTSTLTLDGTNTYVARTFIDGGALRVTNSSSLGATGSAGNGTFVRNNGSLEITNSTTLGEVLFLNGDGFNGDGALRSVSGTNTISSDVQVGWSYTGTGTQVAAADARIGVEAGSTLAITGAVTGSNAVEKVGGGLLRFSAAGGNSNSGATTVSGGTLALAADATVPADAQPAVLHVAVTESGLASKVERGENAGTTLAHDHVVRQWIGPFPLNGGTARAQRRIALPPAWNRARLDVVAFVADPRSGAVLQAVSAHQCARS